MPRGSTAWWAGGVTRWAKVGLLQKISWRPRWTLSHTTAASRCSRERGWSPGGMLMYLIGSALSYRTRNLPYDKSGQTMVCAGGKDKDACQVSQFKCNHLFLFSIINLMFMDRETVEVHLCVKEMSLVGKSERNVFMASWVGEWAALQREFRESTQGWEG